MNPYRWMGASLLLVGLALAAWPVPLSMLGEPYRTLYATVVLCLGEDWKDPGGSNAALPFVWLLTLPLGFMVSLAGLQYLVWGRAS